MATTRVGRLHLNAFLMGVGHHEAAWRLPESDPFAHVDVKHYQNLARIAERGKLDSVFLADGPVLWNDLGRRPAGALEPTVLLTALAAVTEHIGLIATASTTYNEPYNLARRFASLDHISGGRAGWNIVTTAGLDAARNFNLDALPPHRERYERAAEFIDVSRKLWDSWDDSAALGDKAAGVWGDDTKVYPGHDYIENNLRFTLAREPDNVAANAMLPRVSGQDPATAKVTTLGEEKRINTFLRLTSPSVIAKLREEFPDLPERPDAKTVFVKLRELRNKW